MILRKNRNFVILIGVSVIAGLVLIQAFNSCSLKQLSIISEIEEYKNLYDPQQCVVLVDKIMNLNNECKTEFDILDCG
ncbi:hypothetical protein QVH35_07780 [Candidatus Nitrosotenuis chungbukensis]|uniref:hypothetical protein n=1 Tax=Candidatus Nitrosotenuis chungbukensis TaxID=1353246 RepID=UPI0005B2B735|nr:hypothetical protein [Candidatus Nitrosotenuis chungbukensis]WKT57311.1 hypothetical protein QVH35_07780 [Candidatus Nitrosotenuis chungbukensis]